MKINWKARIKNKTFWLTAVPAVLLLAQAAAKLFGVQPDFGELGNNIADIVNAVFAVLAVLGVTADPTTVGLGDSVRAQGYDKPYDSYR